MRNIIFLTIALGCITTTAAAQIPQDAITYNYDVAGNRTARKVPTVMFISAQSSQSGGSLVKSIGSSKNSAAYEASSEEPYVEEVRNLQYQIYPNPTVDYCMVEIANLPEDISSASVELYAFSGKIVSRQKGITAQNRVNLNGFPGGMYVLRVVVNGQATSFKIVKK
ncbi:MAG: T9SS type A sorting domain-containing protein [Prevotellaceae bacterium]|jgi:hypothetical protein|nr:T9SS type A sorting domain-containing protein [Prevotellaceae bacterium]